MILTSRAKRHSSQTEENPEQQTSSLDERQTCIENDSKEQTDSCQESSDRHPLNQLLPRLAFEGSLGCKKFKFLQDLPTSLPEAGHPAPGSRRVDAQVSGFGARMEEVASSPFDLASDKNIRVKSESNHPTATFGYAYANTDLYENCETPVSGHLEKVSPSKDSATFGGYFHDRKSQMPVNQADASMRAIAPHPCGLERNPSILLIGAVQRSHQENNYDSTG